MPPVGPYPAIGLYWFDNVDPTVVPGMQAPLNQILIRTDQPSIYYKSGPLATDWTKVGIGSGGGGIGVNVQDEGVAIPGNPHDTLNFTGGGVLASDAGGGVATVAIPGVAVSDEGGPTAQTFVIDFTGGGVSAVVIGGVATVTVPAPPAVEIAIEDEGVAQGNANTLNVVGGGASIAVAAGVATLTVPAPPVVPDVIESIPEKWGQTPIAGTQTQVVMSQLVSLAFDDTKMIRDGSVVGIGWRLTSACTAGTLVLEVAKNGAVMSGFGGATTAILNTSGGQNTQAAGIDNYVAGDRLGILITTVGFLPALVTIEAWLEVTPA